MTQEPSDKTVTLKVLDSYMKDVGRGSARIDHDTMAALNASAGDVIAIMGIRRTVAKCLPLNQSDEGQGEIKIDGLIRSNAGVPIGDTVTIKRIQAPPAEKVVVTPFEKIPPIDERYLVDALESVPVTKGDTFMVPYFGGRLTFQVTEVNPMVDGMITQRTFFTISRVTVANRKAERDKKKVFRHGWCKRMKRGMSADKYTFSIPEHNKTSEKEEQIMKDAKDLAKVSDTVIKVSVEFFEEIQGLIEAFPWAEVYPDGTVEYTYPNDKFLLKS